jgi:hypothetical protein
MYNKLDKKWQPLRQGVPKMTLKLRPARNSETERRYKDNPFFTEAEAVQMASGKVVTTVRRTKKGVTVIESASGIVLSDDTQVFAQESHVDTAQFIKVFSGAMKEFFSLQEAGRRVFEVVWYQIEKNPNQDTVTLHESLAVDAKIGRATWFRGITALLDARIIARAISANMYFFNPKLAWNGDRMVFMQKYVRKKELDKNLSLFSSEQ